MVDPALQSLVILKRHTIALLSIEPLESFKGGKKKAKNSGDFLAVFPTEF
jgi:hypothetical protein